MAEDGKRVVANSIAPTGNIEAGPKVQQVHNFGQKVASSLWLGTVNDSLPGSSDIGMGRNWG
jgi:hypothetical protein